MLVLTNYTKKKGPGKFPLLGLLPHKSTQSISYEGQTDEFYFPIKLATACPDPVQEVGSSRIHFITKSTQHLRSVNRSQIYTTHKYRTFKMELLFVALQTGLQMKKP